MTVTGISSPDDLVNVTVFPDSVIVYPLGTAEVLSVPDTIISVIGAIAPAISSPCVPFGIGKEMESPEVIPL